MNRRIQDVLESISKRAFSQYTELLTAYVLLNDQSVVHFAKALEIDPGLVIHTLLLAKRLQEHQGDELALAVSRIGKKQASQFDFDSYVEQVEENYINTGLISQSKLIKDLSVSNQVLSSLIHQDRRVSHSLPIQFKEYARSGNEEMPTFNSE